MYDAYMVTAENGVIGWNDYPSDYVGYKQRLCKDDHNAPNRFFNTSGMEEDYVSNERLRQIVSKQPVGVAIYSNFDCLNAYVRGIMLDSDCACSDPNANEVNHAVTIIGYGINKTSRHGCREYWIIKNSWGADWGEHGTFRLCADRYGRTAEYGTCQVNSYIMWPTLD